MIREHRRCMDRSVCGEVWKTRVNSGIAGRCFLRRYSVYLQSSQERFHEKCDSMPARAVPCNFKIQDGGKRLSRFHRRFHHRNERLYRFVGEDDPGKVPPVQIQFHQCGNQFDLLQYRSVPHRAGCFCKGYAGSAFHRIRRE